MDVYLSKGHMLPMQWFPIVDVYSDEPAIPTGYVRLNCIINTMDEAGAVQVCTVPLLAATGTQRIASIASF